MKTAVGKRTTDWQRVCREITFEILDQCGVTGAPVNAWRLARRLGMRVAFDSTRSGRSRLNRFTGRTSPPLSPEREQWMVALEIGEAYAFRVINQLNVDPCDASPGRRKQITGMLALGLLLPEHWFEDDAAALDGDVVRLKRIYETASHELILMNLLRLPQLTLVSVFDDGRLSRRRGNGQLAPPPVLPLEHCVRRIAHDSGQPATATGQGVRVQCWPVIEAGRGHEFLRTTAIDGIDGSAADDDDEWSEPDCDCETEMACAN